MRDVEERIKALEQQVYTLQLELLRFVECPYKTFCKEQLGSFGVKSVAKEWLGGTEDG